MSVDVVALGGALIYVLTSGLRSATPLVFASVGGCFSAQVRVFNIALEGMMLAGAFAGFVASDYSGSALVGLTAGAAAGAVVALVIGVCCVDFRADEVVVGFSVNVAVLSLTAVMLDVLYGSQGSHMSTRAGLIGSFTAGPLEGIPVLGPLVDSLDGVILLGLLAVGGAHFLTYYTRDGLRMRAIGDGPEIAASAGINVRHYRYQALLIGGVLCGVGGAYLPLSGLSLFSVGMTAGQGFIAVAAVIFGSGRPALAAGAAFLFGLATALAIQLERLEIPTEVVQALPYLVTIVALLIHARRSLRAQTG